MHVKTFCFRFQQRVEADEVDKAINDWLDNHPQIYVQRIEAEFSPGEAADYLLVMIFYSE